MTPLEFRLPTLSELIIFVIGTVIFFTIGALDWRVINGKRK